MGELMSRLRQVNVTSRSPRESVEVRLAPDGTTLTARIGRAGVDGHTEKSFAAELEAAVSRALKGYGQATRHVMSSTDGADRPQTADTSPKPDFAERMAALEVTGASAQNLVIVTRTGGGDVSVQICPGTLRRLRDDQLVSHVNTALDAASRQMQQALTRILTTAAPAAD